MRGRFKVKLDAGSTWRRFHGWILVFWLGPGAVLSWVLRASVPYVNFLSWYAIIISTFTAWQAARTEAKVDVDQPND